MYTNVNLAAPVGVLAFLGTGLLLFGLLLILIFGAVRRNSRIIVHNGIAIGIIVSAYITVMLIFSAASTEHLLARGAEKHFCEIDCHLAYSIENVRQVALLDEGGKDLKPNGVFYLVTLRTRFDEATISRTRGNGSLSPNPRTILLIDDNRNLYSPSYRAQSTLERTGVAGTPINTALRPDESYSTVYAFDVPQDIRNPVLSITESDWITHLIIGHENSLAHKKTSLRL